MKAEKFQEVSKATLNQWDIFNACFYFIKEDKQREMDFYDSSGELLTLLYNLWEKSLLGEVLDCPGIDFDEEQITFALNEELFDIMNNYSPDDCYFGSHIGDGSLLGYWPSEDLD